MENQVDHIELLGQQVSRLEAVPSDAREVSYFAQEALRFYSIAETLRTNDMLKNASAVERQISHILGRSLLEGFFWLIYIFDDRSKRAERFEEKANAFRREYGKFWNEPVARDRSNGLEAADAAWSALPRPMDVNSMLAQVKNDHGDRLNYLYYTYRISSFDTHGNSMDSLFQYVFEKPCNFAVLDFGFGFDFIANHYLVIMGELHEAGEI